MKIVGVIPSRYASTRLPGKGLADICGKPMIWWVYHQVRRVSEFSDLIVAIDHPEMQRVCEEHEIPYVMTRDDHPDHICRVWEVSEHVQADYYVCVNGDEPLIEPDCIQRVLPDTVHDGVFFCGAMRTLTDPAEVIDFANLKLAVTDSGECIYMSRGPIPYPRGTLDVVYKKYVGIECFNKAALDFFVSTPMGRLERAEDIDHLRFLENGHRISFKDVPSESLSVDTKKDLERVRSIMKKRIDAGEVTL